MEACDSIDAAARAARAGRPVVFPTDTVYGIGVAVSFAETPQIIYQIKQRDAGKPIPWLISSEDELRRYGRDLPSWAEALAHAFWPGPLTLIVHASDQVPPTFAAAGGSIALRMPDDEAALALIRAVGCPMATSSANIQAQMPPHLLSELSEELRRSVGACVGDERERSGLSSTIADCRGSQPRILRTGGISAEDILRVAGSALS